ncbi:MAG: hypothetical protein O3A00_19810 [Planctomycetota bacterium]|nr:hypothetical protein [Planctomycetota bacterium]
MNSVALLFIAVAISTQQLAADMWNYLADGPASQAEHSVGKAGNFRSFKTVTKERPEKVILWYAKKLKISDDYALARLPKPDLSVSRTPSR